MHKKKSTSDNKCSLPLRPNLYFILLDPIHNMFYFGVVYFYHILRALIIYPDYKLVKTKNIRLKRTIIIVSIYKYVNYMNSEYCINRRRTTIVS